MPPEPRGGRNDVSIKARTLRSFSGAAARGAGVVRRLRRRRQLVDVQPERLLRGRNLERRGRRQHQPRRRALRPDVDVHERPGMVVQGRPILRRRREPDHPVRQGLRPGRSQPALRRHRVRPQRREHVARDPAGDAHLQHVRRVHRRLRRGDDHRLHRLVHAEGRPDRQQRPRDGADRQVAAHGDGQHRELVRVEHRQRRGAPPAQEARRG